MTEALILDEAKRIVYTDRNESYGTPMANHQRTADLWTSFLATGYKFTPRDVCMFNILQKVSRDRHMPGRDNAVDIAGYAENAELCVPFTHPATPKKS